LGEHVRRVGRQPATMWREAASLASRYLAALWRGPCYDCWEEFPESVHTYSLAAIYGGLRAHQELWDGNHQEALEIGAFLREGAVRDGRFVKSTGTEEVDGSLLGLAIPYRVVEPRHPLMVATVEEIERKLRDGGGVHRYRADTFYGGGEWILLTAWLAWYRLELGEQDRAGELIAWVENQSDEAGQLPEQVPASLNAPSFFEPWRRRWGEIAKPLLWSHASYIIARHGS
ncbi:MAG: glycoside hydrolase family 15 protein, partial [Acidimicrobiia bacterium]